MNSVKPAGVGNRLLAGLPRRDHLHLLAGCEQIELVGADVLIKQGEQVRFVYFPINGFVSQMTTIEHGMRLEIAQVGNEGMLGSELALGITQALLQWLVRGAGSSHRMDGMRPRSGGSSGSAQR